MELFLRFSLQASVCLQFHFKLANSLIELNFSSFKVDLTLFLSSDLFFEVLVIKE
jgi:hypothetical protein